GSGSLRSWTADPRAQGVGLPVHSGRQMCQYPLAKQQTLQCISLLTPTFSLVSFESSSFHAVKMVSSNPRPAMLESAHIYTTGGPNAQIASAANQRNLCHFLCRSVHSDDSEVPIQPLCPLYVQQRSGSQRSEPHRRIPSRRSRVGFRCPRATHRPPHVHVAQNAANFSRQVCRFRSDCKSAEGRR